MCVLFMVEIQKPVCNMYRQFDGYPTGHGAELAEFLNGGRLVNGLIQTKTVDEGTEGSTNSRHVECNYQVRASPKT